MFESSNVRVPKYNLFFTFAGMSFIISGFLYLIYIYCYFFSDFFTRYTYMTQDIWGLILGIAPGLLFFIPLTIFAIFLFSGKNKAYITVFSAVSIATSIVWMIFVLISYIPGIALQIDYIFSFSDVFEIITAILSTIYMLCMSLNILLLLLCFLSLFSCHLIQKNNNSITFIWIFPKLLSLLLVGLALLDTLLYGAQFALITLSYSGNPISDIDDFFYEFDKLYDNNVVISSNFYIAAFFFLGIGIFILSCGLKYHSTGSRPQVIVGTKIMED